MWCCLTANNDTDTTEKAEALPSNQSNGVITNQPNLPVTSFSTEEKKCYDELITGGQDSEAGAATYPKTQLDNYATGTSIPNEHFPMSSDNVNNSTTGTELFNQRFARLKANEEVFGNKEEVNGSQEEITEEENENGDHVDSASLARSARVNSANGGGLSDIGGEQSDNGGEQSDNGGGQSDIGGEQSDIGGEQSDIGGAHSDIGGAHSDIVQQPDTWPTDNWTMGDDRYLGHEPHDHTDSEPDGEKEDQLHDDESERDGNHVYGIYGSGTPSSRETDNINSYEDDIMLQTARVNDDTHSVCSDHSLAQSMDVMVTRSQGYTDQIGPVLMDADIPSGEDEPETRRNGSINLERGGFGFEDAVASERIGDRIADVNDKQCTESDAEGVGRIVGASESLHSTDQDEVISNNPTDDDILYCENSDYETFEIERQTSGNNSGSGLIMGLHGDHRATPEAPAADYDETRSVSGEANEYPGRLDGVLSQSSPPHRSPSNHPFVLTTNGSVGCTEQTAETPAHKHYYIHASIDIGTTFSGYCFEYTNDHVIHVNRYLGSEKYQKSRSALLVHSNGDLVTFGDDAIEQYMMSLPHDDDSSNEDEDAASRDEDCCLYHPLQWQVPDATSDDPYIVSTDRRQRLPAQSVLALIFKYYHDALFECLQNEKGRRPSDDAIKWVIAVPHALHRWGRTLIREAAVQAKLCGETGSNLDIVDQVPGLISYFRYHKQREASPADRHLLDGSCVVVDIGGSGTRITNCTVSGLDLETNQIAASPAGGLYLRDEIVSLIGTALGGNYILEELQNTYWCHWNTLLFDIEKQIIFSKRLNDANVTIRVRIQNCDLVEIIEDMRKQHSNEPAESTHEVTYNGSQIAIKVQAIQNILKQMVDIIVEQINISVSPNAVHVSTTGSAGGMDHVYASPCAHLQQVALNQHSSQSYVPQSQMHGIYCDTEPDLTPVETSGHKVAPPDLTSVDTSAHLVAPPDFTPAKTSAQNAVPHQAKHAGILVTGGLAMIPYVQQLMRLHLHNVHFADEPFASLMKGCVYSARQQSEQI